MPPPPLSRFPSGPNTISPYHQQFPSHASQGHGSGGGSGSHGLPLGTNPSYLGSAGAQLGAFSGGANGGVLGAGAGAGGLNGAFGAETGLASHAARMGFAHAANLQQQQHGQAQQQHGGMLVEHTHMRGQSGKGRIREVWKHNLHEEMAVLRDLVDKYPFISMDTEFPGVVSRPMGGFRGKSDYHYQCLRTNVDMLKIIQLGITLFNEDGEMPPARPNSADSMDLGGGGLPGRRNANHHHGPFPYCWQFNFKFSLKDDMYNEKSIESLQSAGIDFGLLERDGIDPHEFAALLIPSGLVCYENVRWISFHGGYDFGYLTKLLICEALPSDEVDFDEIMKKYFPTTYDVKHLMKFAIRLHNTGLLTPNDPGSAEALQKFEHKSGLENIAETLKVKRVGNAHQAGSDSLLTGRVFFAMRDKIFGGDIPDEHVGKVWGLNIPDTGLYIAPMLAAAGAAGETNTNTPTPGQNGAAGGTAQNGAPSTPNTGSVGLASTPVPQAHNTNGMSMGPMTPGGGGGVFGNFAFMGSTR